MTPVFDNNIIQLHLSDARQLPIPDESVDCVVTSPPYWGLRDYGLSAWEGGDENCDHTISHYNDNMKPNVDRPFRGDRSSCLHCGARRVDSGIGLEPTPEEYCANMVEVFREVWRVLKPTGTVWLNLGDSYASSRPMGTSNNEFGSYAKHRNGFDFGRTGATSAIGDNEYRGRGKIVDGLKPKDLVGIPWRVAFALQADGWYLRSDIIWSKKSPMPESVQDRPTKAHEYIFLLTKSPKYYYDADAIREKPVPHAPDKPPTARKQPYFGQPSQRTTENGYTPHYEPPETGRNKRTVWEINTHPYPEAHFATYPEKLVEPCIMAGTSEKGVCAECGKPWERIMEVSGGTIGTAWHDHTDDLVRGMRDNSGGKATDGTYKREHKGWQPTCECNADIVSATVLDPFVGSGTTMAVAQRLGRRGIGTDLNEEYLALASKRLRSISMPMNMGI